VLILAGWSVWDPLQQERSRRPLEPGEEAAEPAKDRDMRPALWAKEASPVERMQAAEAWAEQGPAAVPQLVRALSHADPLTRKFACFALGRIGVRAQSAAADLAVRLHDENSRVRENAIFALNRVSPELEPLFPELVRLLADEKSAVRAAAADSLVRSGEKAVPAVCAAVESPAVVARREAAIILRRLQTRHETAIAAARKLWQDADATVRIEAFQTLAAMDAAKIDDALLAVREGSTFLIECGLGAIGRCGAEAESALPQLAQLLSAGRPEVRLAAIRSATQLGRVAHPLVPNLTARLAEHNAAIRQAAVEALVSVGADKELIVPVLSTMLLEFETAFFAAALLRNLEPDEVARSLVPLAKELQASNVFARRTAAAALAGFGPTTRAMLPALIAALEDEDEVVRHYAAFAVGGNGPAAAAAAPALVRLLMHKSAARRSDTSTAVWAVGEIGPAAEAAVPLLIELYSQRPVAHPVLHDETIVALSKLGTRSKAVLATLLTALDDSSPCCRWRALATLTRFRIEERHLFPLVRKALEDHHPFVRAQAVIVLGQFEPTRHVVAALTHALADGNPYVQTAASLTLARLGGTAGQACARLTALADEAKNAVPNHLRPCENASSHEVPAFIVELENQSVREAALLALAQIRLGSPDTPRGFAESSPGAGTAR
jgi:HEAT repeat protein